MSGEKTVTRRQFSTNPRSPWWHEECALVVGRTYAVCPGRAKNAVGRVKVVSVRSVPLGYLTEDEAQREGFEDGPAFMAAFIAINGSYDPNELVWRIEFELVHPDEGTDG
jgi:hypothetical protein